jgi:hypothetical protein
LAGVGLLVLVLDSQEVLVHALGVLFSVKLAQLDRAASPIRAELPGELGLEALEGSALLE